MPLVEAATARQKSNTVSIKEIASSKSTCQITETRTRALVASQQSGDLSPSNSSKAIGESNQFKQATEDKGCTVKRHEDGRKRLFKCSNTGQRLAIEQAQDFQPPGEMGEKRLAYNAVVSTINNKNMTNHLPEGSVMPLSMPIPLSISMPQTEALRLGSNEPVLTPMVKQPDFNIAISKDKETSAIRHLPEAAVAQPIPSPVLPVQAADPCQQLGEASLPIEVVLRQPGRSVTAAEPVPGDLRSLKIKTAQRQSEIIKAPSVEGEGRYLEQATAYVRERISRHALVNNAFVL